jgi:hypothetical protein
MWSRITGNTSYDVESAYTFLQHDEIGADCELKGATDTFAMYSMEYRKCPNFLLVFGAILGIAAFVQAFFLTLAVGCCQRTP